MKKSILIMFLAAIFLAGCIGGNGDFDPMPEEAIAEVPEVEEDLESWDEETEPELVPLSVSANGFDRRIECGGDISAVVEAKNAVGSVAWEITGLPSWAKAEQSGDANSVVTVAGAFPFESCDETSNDVKFKACDEDGRCKETTLKLKTKIPVVSINAKLPDLVVPYGNTVELKLKAKGGSGEYGWTTIVPASLAGADSGSSDEVAISGDAVSFTAKGVGSHEVEVFVEDAALGSQRAELEKKYADKDRMLMRDSATFKVLVKESGFVLKGEVVDAEGKVVQRMMSPGRVASKQGAEMAIEAVGVPYDGRLLVWVEGVAESYEVSLPAESGLFFSENGKKVASLSKREKVEVVPEGLDDAKDAVAFSGVSVSARNVAGESASLVISDLAFSVDPCATVVIAKGGGTEFGPYEISKEDVEIPLEVQNGIGPFKWQVLSDVKPVDYVDLNEEDAAKVFDKSGNKAMEDIAGIDMRMVEGRAYLFSKGIGYSRIEDAAMKRWELICRDEKDSESCRKALIKGDLNYKGVTRLLGGDVEEGLSYDDLKGKPMEFKESIFVEVKDEGCQAKLVAKNSLKVTIPGPEKEVLGDAYISYKVGQEGSWGGADGTHANLQLWSKDEKLIETGKKNVRKAWDEQIKKYHWNRPAFPSFEDLGERPTFDINKLVIKLWREWNASWEMEFDIVQFHVVGKNWYYFDDTDYNCTQGAHPSGAKECEIPMDLKKAEKGKWYLRCNPNDSDPKSESCGYSVK